MQKISPTDCKITDQFLDNVHCQTILIYSDEFQTFHIVHCIMYASSNNKRKQLLQIVYWCYKGQWRGCVNSIHKQIVHDYMIL